jgi:uncharacterized iron-regulated protein
MRRMRSPLAASLVLVLVGGCCRPACRPCAPCGPAGVARATAVPPPPRGATPPPAAAPAAVSVPKDPPPGAIVEGGTGARLTFDELIERLARAQVVYVGERHDQAAHHVFQKRVFAALVDRWTDGPVALGMEMFQRPAQPALDAYVAGTIDEAALLEKTEWKTRWGFGWEMYAPMLRRARDEPKAAGEPGRLRVVALNAPKEVTRAVAKGGLEALTPEQRGALPPLDLGDAGHRAFVLKAFGAHGAEMPKDRFERFYTAQVIWEETMSSSVAEWLAANGPNARMVVVVGSGHVADRFGVPARAEKKSGRPYATVVCEVTDPAAEPDADAEPARLDKTYADFTAWFAPSAPPKPKKPADKPTPPAPTPAKP